MTFKIQMKDPDGVYESVRDAAQSSLGEAKGLTETELEKLCESRRDELDTLIRKWFQYGEYVTVEIDTEAMTATVCEV